MICIDANIWVYYFDSRADEHERVRPQMADTLENRRPFCNTAIQMEVVHFFANQFEDTKRYVDRLLGFEDLAVADLVIEDVERARELLVSHPHVGIGGRDASLVASMERRGVPELWTHDQGLKRLGDRLDWLTVKDPVAA